LLPGAGNVPCGGPGRRRLVASSAPWIIRLIEDARFTERTALLGVGGLAALDLASAAPARRKALVLVSRVFETWEEGRIQPRR